MISFISVSSCILRLWWVNGEMVITSLALLSIAMGNVHSHFYFPQFFLVMLLKSDITDGLGRLKFLAACGPSY